VIGSEEIQEQLLALIRQYRGRLAAFSDSQKSEIAAELRQIQEALRESEGRFQLVAQATHEAVWDMNLLTGEVWRNQEFETLFGYSPQEIENSAEWWKERIHPEDQERVLGAIPALLAGSVHPVSYEYRFRRADGSYAHVFDRGFFLTNADGRPVRMIGAMLDISERKQAEDNQREYTRRLQSLTRQLFLSQENERRRLARALHDEIAQLLTAHLLQLDLCVGVSGPVLASRLANAVKLAHDMMARVRALSLDLRPVMLDDMGLLHSLQWHVENFSQRTGVQVDFENSGIDGRFASELESTVYRLIQEALSNVAHHAGVTEARLKVWSNRNQVCVEVEDSGIGFDLTQVLQSNEGTGLTEMRERVAWLGGQFALESTPGKGTRLVASLPLVSGESVSGK
jgi:two-component system sensor histidine kinase UhpB